MTDDTNKESHSMIRRGWTLLLLLSVGWTLCVAGNTGKIAGVIKDSQTGEALIGVNVRLEGTSQGAATNVDGYYVILNIPPGTYVLSFSALGYNKKRVENVRVSIDLTTTIDMQLDQTVVDVGLEITTVAERPLVQRDQTAKTAVVGSEQIAVLPVTEVSQILGLQAGFVAGSLRGGRSGEVAYWIDGVPVTDAYDGSQVVEVNKSFVQELALVSGAFNAEYGQAMSGIVNIATKEGGPKFSGSAGFYGGNYLVGDNTLFPGNTPFDPVGIRNFEASLSGPVIGEKVTFFATGRYIYFDGWLKGFNRFNPWNISYTDSAGTFHLARDANGRADSAAVPLNSSERWYGQGKLTFHITPVLKLTGNYIYDFTTSQPYNRNFFYNPYGLGHDHNTSHTVIAQLTHTLSDRTFYTVGGSIFWKDYKYYLYKDPYDTRYAHPRLFNTPDAYSFFTGGTDLRHTYRNTTSWLLKADVSSQITAQHLLKIGAEFRQHKLMFENIQLAPVQTQESFTPDTSNPFINTRILDLSSTSHDYYEHRPMEVSAYIQDKMEFRDLIVNVGVRFDYFQPDAQVLNNGHPDPADPLYYTYTVDDPNIFDPKKPNNRFFDNNGNGNQDPGEPDKTYDDRVAYWYKRAPTSWQLSPRVGFSFPITERGIVHFSFGYFFQIPRLERLYENPFFKVGPGTPGVVGNAALKPEQTINGELGVQQQLSDDISADLTVYMRDVRNLTGTRNELVTVFGGSIQYSRYTNSDFGFIKGIVFTLNKRFSGGFSATVDYTFQVARGTASDPQEAYSATVGGRQPEVQLTPLGWDQRHTLNFTATYSTPTWGGSLIGRFGSGTPYTPRATVDVSSLLTNSQLKPSTATVDLQAFYTVPVSVLRLVLFARVFNLLDTRNEVAVFDDTGRAGFTTDEARTLASNPDQYVNTVSEWYRRATHYSEPRRIEFGLNLEF